MGSERFERPFAVLETDVLAELDDDPEADAERARQDSNLHLPEEERFSGPPHYRIVPRALAA